MLLPLNWRNPRRHHLVMFPSIEKTRSYTRSINTCANLMVESSDHLEEAPKVAWAGGPGAQRQLAAGERILTQVRTKKNKLQDANIKIGEELKDVRAQLADSVKENKKLQCCIFSMCSNEPLYSSAKKWANRVYICRYADQSPRRGDARIHRRSFARAFTTARTS